MSNERKIIYLNPNDPHNRDWNVTRRYSMKVYPAGLGREVYRTLEICGHDTLDDLCSIILQAFDFIHEHLYEFCMDNRMYSEESYQSYPDGEGLSTNITIDEITLVEGQKFSLHYDFGDDWMFTIRVAKITEIPAYLPPEVVKSKGKIKQYPDWDEEE